jgi:uncharacterized protein (TIGR03089 family)
VTVPDQPESAVAALAAAMRTNPSRPLVTFYDDATGERVELSVQTFDNWVAKLANLFTDELLTEPGDVVRVALPTHWQSTVVAVAAWSAGLAVGVSPSVEAELAVVGPEQARSGVPPGGARQVLACSLRPLGGRFTDPLPAGWLDFGADVPPQPDVRLTPRKILGGQHALVAGNGTTTHAQLVECGRRAAHDMGLLPGGRLCTDANPASDTGLVAALVAPLVVGASVVLVANPDPGAQESRAHQEQVTCWAMADR